jgi:hypothetical protein
MCSSNSDDGAPHMDVPSPRAAWDNLRQPGPLRWKIERFIANTTSKIVRRQACCGRAGEPGC